MDTRGEIVEDWMTENSLIMINKPDDTPTLYSRAWKTTSTPDLAIGTDDIHGQASREVCSQLGGSDHRPIILDLQSLEPPTQSMDPSWNYKKAKWDMFRKKADSLCKQINHEASLNKMVQEFTGAILEAAKATIPRGKRRNYKPYWSNTLDSLQKELNAARETMEKFPTLENTRNHNSVKDAFNQQKKQEIQKSWHEKTRSLNMEKDSNKLWSLVRTLNEENRCKYSKTVLEVEGEHYTDKKAANILANLYHQESQTALPSSRRKEIIREIKRRKKQPTSTASMTVDFTLTELGTAIKKLKTKKAPGKDGVTNDMIKKLGISARQTLLNICNLSWSSGKFPDAWREAITIPILKKGKKRQDKSSYRPISLLSCLGKVMERMVNARLLDHLEGNQLLTNTQSAYRKNRSTEDQLVYLTQGIENAFQERKKTLAVFVDLTKAFDKVSKDGLLLKLLNKEVGGRMFKWLQDFLQHRTMRVRVDGKLSHQVTVQEGVPQGGVISPTLFLIFINDIAGKLNQCVNRALHADDLAIWTSAEHLSTASVRIQEALNHIEEWANQWGVKINASKTVASVFSLSTRPEKVTLKLNGKELNQESNPTYLGIKLDKRLTWSQHIKDVEVRATRKLAIMKKLAGTSWGANNTILKRVFTGTIRPTLEYGSSAWVTASKSNTSRLSKVQNTGMRIITGALKTTPIQAMEKHTGLHSLEERRNEKVMIHSEKLLRMPDHPMNAEISHLTKNRLKRTSFNHVQKSLHEENNDLLPTTPEKIELLQSTSAADVDITNVNIQTELPGIEKKCEQHPLQQKALSLELIDSQYNRKEWTHVFTDGSAERAVKNGGAGILIHHTDGKMTPRAFPTGSCSTNYRAESEALLHAVQMFTRSQNPPPKIAFFTDCRSVLETLQSEKLDQQSNKIKTAIKDLSEKSTVTLQWIPSHCGIAGNEKADALSKAGSKMEQPDHPVTYKEAKTIINSQYKAKWSEKMDIQPGTDDIHCLERHQQTTLFRLRTGHCRLMSHMHRLGIAHSDECPCGTGPQDPDHVLQYCPNLEDLRKKTWPNGADLRTKLWGSRHHLETTVGFVRASGLDV